MSLVMQSAVAQQLKNTLEGIETDTGSAKTAYRKWCKVEGVDDAFVDYAEWAGPGYASEKSEGGDIPLGTMGAGPLWRAWARTFGLSLAVTSEAIEDNKYKDVIRAAKNLTRSMDETVDLDATNMLSRAFNANYVGGDDVSMCSTAHPLVHGGTFSNQASTGMTPSRAAVIQVTTELMNMPGHNGIVHGYRPEQILCPNAQWAVWLEIINSTYAPEAGEFNRINVVNSQLDLSVVPLKHLQSSDTNWFMTTDHESPIRVGWRRRPTNNTWVERNNEVMMYSITARWLKLWTNARKIFGVNA